MAALLALSGRWSNVERLSYALAEFSLRDSASGIGVRRNHTSHRSKRRCSRDSSAPPGLEANYARPPTAADGAAGRLPPGHTSCLTTLRPPRVRSNSACSSSRPFSHPGAFRLVRCVDESGRVSALTERRTSSRVQAIDVAAYRASARCRPRSCPESPHASHAPQTTRYPLVRLNVELEQNAAAFRYHT